MRAPEFWDGQGGLSDWLRPLGALYALGGAARRRLIPGERVGVPVICVGNLVAGGAGKTPVVIDLLRRLKRMGLAAHGLSRGYGGSEAGPARVDGRDAVSFGDEPLLLAREAPCWVARDRLAGARRAVAEGAGIIVMDDGFQNPSLVKDLSLLVVDGAYGFGNGRVIPAGPLRESVAVGIARADAIVVMGSDEAGIAGVAQGRPVLPARLEPAGGSWQGTRTLAFAGIARPAKFFDTLRRAGAELVAARSFPDHHAFARAEIEALIAEAEAAFAVPVTTEKDLVRLPADLAARVRSLPVEIKWRDGGAAIASLLNGLADARR